jgi:protein phosphatase
MKIEIPELSLVVLVGTSGAGKSTFAGRHFKATEVLSSDYCRAIVADDEAEQSANADAFDVLGYIAAKRLAAGRLTVVDATNVQPDARKPFIALAREHHCLPVAIVLDVPPKVAHQRNRERQNRNFGEHVVQTQHRDLRRSIKALRREGFRHVFVLDSQEQIDAATVTRVQLWNNRKQDTGPFDIIGDVHGCFDELVALLTQLGYEVSGPPDAPSARAPLGRKAIFLGDLVDRGPGIVSVLKLVMAMVASGQALCVPGNHEQKLLKKLTGKEVRVTHGLAQTLEQLAPESREFKDELATFIHGLVSHYLLDGGKLVVAHAGLPAKLQGRGSGRVRDFCLFGETTGETDEFGLPVRYNWADDYRGTAMVVYGHTPVPTPEWNNRTICIDTGCVFGGSLTALRYPERELVQVKAKCTYYEPAKPFLANDAAAATIVSEGRAHDDLLDIKDVLGKRVVATRTQGNVTIREDNARAALEVMSRFAEAPNWLIYLPPTMSPSETVTAGPLLEHPREAFAYYERAGVSEVVCEEKHMGSRAVVVVCQNAEVARRRFHANGDRLGAIVTRTGRPFFPSNGLEGPLLDRLRSALTAADFWRRFETDWVCLDAELMPWSVKAQELLREQYASTGTAAMRSLDATVRMLEGAAGDAAGAAERINAFNELLTTFRSRKERIERYVAAYRQYCWPVRGIGDLRLAPFHLLATERKVHTDQSHVWHMETLAELCRQDPEVLLATPFRTVNLEDNASRDAAMNWWAELTSRGGEGMVVKPMHWLVKGKRGLAQPAIKCRGPEYLRLIYGPEYDAPEHLQRLRARNLSTKRSLALREFSLGLEGLHRFVEGEPLYRVHECVFGVLALESEPVDPRL